MFKLATFAAIIAVVASTVSQSTASPAGGVVDALHNVSSGSASVGNASDAGVVESGYQVADVSGAQACGGEGFDYSRFWVGPMPKGDATKLSCVSGYRCEAQGPNPIFWCKQYALPLNAKCGGYTYYTLFKCIDGTACTVDPVRYEPRCLPVDSA
ncbi:hypothetical protein PHYPSEUDO_001843 [Phytophthora pseudosyringae]|uniref:Secreted protein n=1 Tax=Phytophthora pseudosyringae TaxID=221518 RepID=A0A8T1VZ25_9STRA|nr:hypothetical protein PHYPSEUDO_001843 [Phytophthora pseudosyringae]